MTTSSLIVIRGLTAKVERLEAELAEANTRCEVMSRNYHNQVSRTVRAQMVLENVKREIDDSGIMD